MAAGQVEVEVLDDADHTRGLGGASIRRHGHEVELHGQVDGSGQVAHEHEGAFEHADEQGRAAGVVPGDLLPELSDPLLELFLSDDRLAQVWIGYWLATSG